MNKSGIPPLSRSNFLWLFIRTLYLTLRICENKFKQLQDLKEDAIICRNNQKTRNRFIFATSQFQGIMMMIRPLGEKRWMNYDHTRHLTMSFFWWMILTQLNFLQKLFTQKVPRFNVHSKFIKDRKLPQILLKSFLYYNLIKSIDRPYWWTTKICTSTFEKFVFKIEWSINQVS